MLFDHIQEAAAYIRTKTSMQPRFGIVLGTGLSTLADDIEAEVTIPYGEIPHFPVSTVQSHAGKLIFGKLAGKDVVAMAGRFHYYEGYSMQQITFPIRVFKALGVEQLILSNAAGSTNDQINAGDLVIIRDHINLQADNPLRGTNDERLGPRFPDMLHAYDPDLIWKALDLARKLDIPAHSGVYVALQGPNLETPAEYEFMHRIGVDVVGMSTVPEVLVARHMDMKVFAVSVVSNKCYPLEEIRKTTVDDVIAMVQSVEPKVGLLVKELLQSL
jgi:purine-nucleoside phosphorylase